MRSNAVGLATKSMVLVTIMATCGAMAADYVWTGGGDGATWADTANWTGGVKFASSTSNRLIFSNQVANAVVNLPSSINVQRIKFAAGCKAMRLTSSNGSKITNTYLNETPNDTTTETGASIFVETTEPVVIDVVQVMTGGRSVGLAQGAHLEIVKPIADVSSRKGRVYFRTLGESKNSYVKIDYDPTTVEYPLDPVEGGFLFKFVGGTNELAAAVCATVQASPKPIVCQSVGRLRLNAGTYAREVNFDSSSYEATLETVGETVFNSNVTIAPRKFTIDFGGATTFSAPLRFSYNGSEAISQTVKFDGNATIGGGVELVKQGGTYLFDLASGVRVDFTSSVVLTAANVSHHIPTDSSVHYHDMLKCSVVQDDGGSEPAAGHRGGKIHLHAPVTVGSAFYVRGYNVVCEAANVLPSNFDLRWRYEAQSDCAIVDLNGFDQTVTHLNGIGSFNGNDRNIITSAKPCTLTIDDTFSGASSANARIAVQGAITIVHGGTATQEFNSRDVATSGDLTINSGKILLSGTTSIYHVNKITIGEDGELVLSGTSAKPIPDTTSLYFSSEGGGIDASGYQGASLTLANRVYVDGELLTNGVYTVDNVSWLKGSKITVDANYGSAWRKAVDGNWAESGKWTAPPAAGGAAVIDVPGADYVVSVITDKTDMGPLTIANDGTGTATLSVGSALSWPAWATVKVDNGGRILVGDGGVLRYCSYTHEGDNLVLEPGGTLELADGGEATLATQVGDKTPLNQRGGDIVLGGTSKLTLEGGQTPFLGSGKTLLEDSATIETVTGKGANGNALAALRFYTRSTVEGITNHIVVKDQARIHPKDDSKNNLDQVIFGYPNDLNDGLCRIDYLSSATSYFGNQIEIGADWGYAEMNVAAGLVKAGQYGIGVGGFYYSGRTVKNADVVGVLNVSGGAVDVNADQYANVKNRVRGLLLGEGWYDKKTATSDNLFTGYVNLSGGVISNRCGAVILGAGAAKGVWTQTGGSFVNTSVQAKGPMIIGWLGGEGAYVLSNGTVNVSSQNVVTYVGGAETNLTPWVLEAQAPSSADAATGLLSLQGGTFTTAGDVVVGQDGNGTIEVGPGGSLAARSLELKAAAATAETPAHSSTVKFKAGVGSCGRITLSGAMKSCGEARLEFDLSDWDGVSRLRFLACNGLEGTAVAWGNVSFVGVDKADFANAGGSRYLFRQDAKGISIGKMKGAAIIFR